MDSHAIYSRDRFWYSHLCERYVKTREKTLFHKQRGDWYILATHRSSSGWSRTPTEKLEDDFILRRLEYAEKYGDFDWDTEVLEFKSKTEMAMFLFSLGPPPQPYVPVVTKKEKELLKPILIGLGVLCLLYFLHSWMVIPGY